MSTLERPAAVTGSMTAARGAGSAPRTGGRARGRSRLGSTLLAVWGSLVVLFLFFPIAVIVVYSFNEGRTLATFDGVGTGAYARAVWDPVISGAIRVTLIAAVGTAVASTLLGTSAGVALARRPGRWAPWLMGLLGVVLVTPEIVSAVSLLPWFVTLGVDAHLGVFNVGQVRLVIANTLFSCVVVTFVVRARLAGLDESLEEAAADLYATPWRRFTDVTLPLVRPAIVVGALLSFTFTLDNTVLSSFVSVAGSTPWSVYVLASLKAGLRPEIAAVSTLLLGLTLAVLALAVLVLRRDPAGSGKGASQLASMVGS